MNDIEKIIYDWKTGLAAYEVKDAKKSYFALSKVLNWIYTENFLIGKQKYLCMDLLTLKKLSDKRFEEYKIEILTICEDMIKEINRFIKSGQYSYLKFYKVGERND